MGTVNGGSTASAVLTLQSTAGIGTSDYIAFKTGSQTERIRLLTGGALLINGTASYGIAGSLLEVNAASGNTVINFTNWTSGAAGPLLDFNKARSGSIGLYTTALASTDEIGVIRFRGSDGSAFQTGGAIYAYADAAWSVNDYPTRISVHTVTDGSAVLTEAMRIDNIQSVEIGKRLSVGVLGTATNTGNMYIYAPDNPGDGVIYLRINASQANLTAADVFVNFVSTSGIEGSIAGTATPGLIAYNTFTGSHWSQSDSIDKQPIKKKTQTTGLEVNVFAATLEPGTVLVSTNEMAFWKDEVCNHLPKCAVSNKKEDKAVYGTYGGHDKDGDIIVLAVGAGVVKVTNEGGSIEIGDMLCTSSTPGYAMKYNGSDLAVIGFKARQTFNGEKGLIACSHMAG